MNIEVLHRLQAAHQGAQQARIISGQAIAKSKWEPRARAGYAAEWKLGAVQVEPTLKLAAQVFNVSVPLIVEAINDLKTANGVAPTTHNDLDSIWDNLGGVERDAFIRRHLIAVWDAIDRVTA